MTTRQGTNLLVLLLGDTTPAHLREVLARRPEPAARIHIVASPIVSPLDWLATAEDSSHQKAEARVLNAEWTLADQLSVDGEVADVDPIQAVEDTLRDFPADEILIAGDAADSDLEDALRRFNLPITRAESPPRPGHSPAYRALRSLASGRNSATPLTLFVGVNAVVGLFGLLFSLLLVLVLWLTGTL
jgi:hypothetical protein